MSPPLSKENENSHTSFLCPVAKEWALHRAEAMIVMQQVKELHAVLPPILHNTNHLGDIATNIREMKDSLVSAVVGKDQIPASTAEKNMDSYRRIMVSTIGAICFAFTVIIVVIIGAKALIPNIFSGGTP